MLDLELPITLDNSSLEIFSPKLFNFEGTADLFSEGNELSDRDANASDTSYDRPDSIVVDCFGDYLNNVLNRGEGDSGVFASL